MVHKASTMKLRTYSSASQHVKISCFITCCWVQACFRVLYKDWHFLEAVPRTSCRGRVFERTPELRQDTDQPLAAGWTQSGLVHCQSHSLKDKTIFILRKC